MMSDYIYQKFGSQPLWEVYSINLASSAHSCFNFTLSDNSKIPALYMMDYFRRPVRVFEPNGIKASILTGRIEKNLANSNQVMMLIVLGVTQRQFARSSLFQSWSANSKIPGSHDGFFQTNRWQVRVFESALPTSSCGLKIGKLIPTDHIKPPASSQLQSCFGKQVLATFWWLWSTS